MSFGYPVWSPFTTYSGGDSVGYNGLAYVANAIVSGTPPLPANAFWSLLTPTGGGGGGGGGVSNPLTADLDCANFDVYSAGRFNGATVECDTIDPLPGSLTTEIAVGQNLRVVGAGKNLESENDVLGRVATVTQSSLNDVFDRAAGIVSYDPAQKLTVFNAPPLVPTSGIEVVGSVSASSDVVASFGLDNYSLITLGRLLPGLLAKLDSVMAGTVIPTTVTYSSVTEPSSWIPDQSPPEAGGVDNGWRFTKGAGAGGGTKKMNWYPYNPVYGQSVPYTLPVGTNFLKNQLEALWIVITPTINISVQGVIFFNIYTYDYDSPPTPPATYNNRWDYCCNNLALPLTTGGLTLQSGFKYLLCCVDADKIVATPGSLTNITNCNGQFPSQTQQTKLRDPIDIHTDIPHITMTAVALTTGTDPSPPSDPSQVYVSQFAISTTSSSVAAGLDFTIHSIGYRANGNNVEYDLVYP